MSDGATRTGTATGPGLRRLAARVRPPLPALGVLLILVDVLEVLPGTGVPGMVVLIGFLLLDRVAPPAAPVRLVAPPVQGPWRALNSPASKVPSHGVHSLGQTHAIDLVLDPPDGSRPEFGSGGQWRRPEEYPAFGRPLHSPVDGVVARVHQRRRDHRARSGWLSILFLLVVEGSVRQLGGARWLAGNHVVVRADDGACAALVHLRKGSVRVRPGDRVVAGQQLAECGNSGNSSEPHLHVQLCDSPRLAASAGLPMAFRGGATDGTDGLPADGELLGVAAD
ncbi:M23 family metallopeptidase [Modestobacter sp. VKM Ac-2985]|uniref:M23 family metallopeptidase n=1 Tax=Modestobacter sp. VKM Ac-2985 TaxID=3004139 RepID=UPI0022ABBEBA|nr:M23 family metallopeptidase [Modestobacter sp. VKM Ac-2985]MCZ2838852.1 M23 family metallopeptidase [Modestobacter sp. VKM Ac-2985]